MKRLLTRALVRPPAENFSEGLTTAGLGPPEFERAVEQHAAYCAALEQCGLTVTKLTPHPNYPDSTFVEDTAVLTESFDETGCAVITRPGAPSRRGEVMEMRTVLARFYTQVLSIESPGTLDGGDVCQAENHFFIGLSERTNEAGAQQLADLLAPLGYSSSFMDIRKIEGLLHLKSGLAYLGDSRLVVTEALERAFHGRAVAQESQTNSLRYASSDGRAGTTNDRSPLCPAVIPHFEIVRVDSKEAYAANCIRVNDYLLLAAGYQLFADRLRELGHKTIELEMSEFQKMDGGLSCLSLRF